MGNFSRQLPKKRAASVAARPRRWQWGGYIGLKHVALFALSVGLLGLTFAAGLLLQTGRYRARMPISSLSHGSAAPSSVELIKSINKARVDNKLAAIGSDNRLNDVAQKRLQDMIGNQYYSHQTQQGRYYYDLLKEQGIDSYSCENLSLSSNPDAQSHVADWLASTTGHRECLLNNQASKIGIASGVFSPAGMGTDATYLVVTIYASPSD